MKKFIVNALEREDRPFSIDEISELFKAAGYRVQRESIRGRLNSLTYERRIRRTARAMYSRVRDASEVTTPADLADWLQDKPDSVGQIIALRAALRVIPIATGVLYVDVFSKSERWKIVQSVFRAAFIAWVECSQRNRGIARSAEEAGTIVGRYAANAADSSLDAISNAALISGFRENASNYARSVVAHASYAAEALGGAADIWESVRADIRILESSDNWSRRLRELVFRPLWLNGTQSGSSYEVSFPKWARSEWDNFKSINADDEYGLSIWMPWYDGRITGAPTNNLGSSLKSADSRALNLRIASQQRQFWDRDVLAVNTDIAKLIAGTFELDAPIEPPAGPGPQYRQRDGRLSEDANSPSKDEADRQETLQRRLRADVTKLSESLRQASNRYPELANAVAEYETLLNIEVQQSDVTGIWSVGGAIASFAQSYREQNLAKTLAEPLEPQFDAQLQNVVRQHGAFILGFGEGRDLVERADQFALDSIRLQQIEQPGGLLLDQLSSNNDLVDDRTRALHRPVYDSVTEFGWVGSRVGYAAYLIVRNGIRAMIKFTVGDSANVAAIASILTGASTLAGDPNADFIRAAIPVLKEHGSNMIAFFNHSPEMRAYVEWALSLLDEDRKFDSD